jgi:hypothetical protein
MTASAPRSSLHSATHSAMKRFSNSRLPLGGDITPGSSGLRGIDKGAIEDAAEGVVVWVCNGVIRCTFMRSTLPTIVVEHGVAAPAGDLDGHVLGHRPAVRSKSYGGFNLFSHAPNIGDESDGEIVGKRQQSG